MIKRGRGTYELIGGGCDGTVDQLDGFWERQPPEFMNRGEFGVYVRRQDPEDDGTWCYDVQRPEVAR